MCHSRYRSVLGSATLRSPSSSSACAQQTRVWATMTRVSQASLASKLENGSLRSPVALAPRRRSSTWAWGRWRASSTAGSGSAWLVMKTWKRWPTWSVKASLCRAPGWGRSRRQTARVPFGQPAPARSSVASSATPAPRRGRAIGIQGRLPRLLGQGQDRLLDALVAVEPDRELQLAADQFADDGVGRASGVAADQGRLVPDVLGQAEQGHRQHV